MRKKLKKQENNKIMALLIILLSSYFAITSLGKYVILHKEKHIQNAVKFYFNSQLLKENEVQYSLNDWDINKKYNINLDIKNYEDNLRVTQDDIEYEVYITNNSTVADIELAGNITKQNDGTYVGTIAGGQAIDTNLTIQVTRKNNETITDEGISFQIALKSLSRYEKELKANFTIKPFSENTTVIQLFEAPELEYVNLTINNIKEKKDYTIKYNNEKLVIDINNEKIDSITRDGEMSQVILSLEEYENVNIQFIKKDSTQTIKLGEDIIVE